MAYLDNGHKGELGNVLVHKVPKELASNFKVTEESDPILQTLLSQMRPEGFNSLVRSTATFNVSCGQSIFTIPLLDGLHMDILSPTVTSHYSWTARMLLHCLNKVPCN